jgi:lipopolysaccharide transport system ATP-binding protein
VKRLCHRAILMVKGEIVAQGSPNEVVNRYVGLVHEREGSPEETKPLIGNFRHGDAASRIVSAAILNQDGEETTSIRSGERVTVRIRARFDRAVEDPMVGMLIRNRLGIEIFGTNTRIEHIELGTFSAADVLEIDFHFLCQLTRQDYTLTVATQHSDGASQDWLDDVLQFSVVDEREKSGVANLATEVSWRVSHGAETLIEK